MKICRDENRPILDDPAALEAASLFQAQRTIDAHYDLGAPEPPTDSLAPLIESSSAHETDVARVIALRQSAEMRAYRLAPRMCRRGLHELTPDNTYQGKRGTQCNACRNASYRDRRKAAA